MLTQFIFELKRGLKNPLLYLGMIALVLFSFAQFQGEVKISTRVYMAGDSREKLYSHKNFMTQKEAVTFIEDEALAQIDNDEIVRQFLLDSNDSYDQITLKNAQDSIAKLTEQIAVYKSRDFKKIQKFELAHDSLSVEDRLATQYLLDHNIPAAPKIALQVDALPMIATVLKQPGATQQGPTKKAQLTIPLIIFLGSTLLASVYLTFHRRQKTIDFVDVLPLKKWQILSVNFAVTILLGLLMFLVGILIFIAIVALWPGHSLGFWQYPFGYILQNQFLVVTIGEFFAKYFYFFFLWLLFLASLQLFLAQLTKQPIILVAVTALLLFLGPLGLLYQNSFKAFQTFFPSFYLGIADVVLNRGSFADISYQSVSLIFLAWSSIFLIFVAAIVKKRGRV